MKTSKSLVTVTLFAFGALFGVITPASATEVDYSTTGSFSTTGNGTLTGTGGSTLTFVGYNDTCGSQPCVNAPGNGDPIGLTPTIDALGDFQINLPVGQTINGTGTFTLTINQTMPAAPNQSLSGQLSGSVNNISGTTGTVYVEFSQTSLNIGGITYTLENLQAAPTCSSNCAVDTLALSSSDTIVNVAIATPEPAFYGLTAAGLIGLFAMAKWRRARTAA
jgi:hypothetical protein